MPTSQNTPIGKIVRPPRGWLHTLRGALGLTLAEVAQRLKVTAPGVRSFEQAEAEDRITLASLRRVAAAMDCDLVYALVPRTDSTIPLAKEGARDLQGKSTDSHSMAAPPADAPARKVIDLTWRTLHGDS